MANIVVPDSGLESALNALLLSADWTSADLHLYTNYYTPVEGSTLADFTECTDSWYSPQPVGPWAAATGPTGSHWYAQGTNAIFTNSTGSPSTPIYGGFVTDAGGTLLLFAGLFDGAPLVIAPSQNLTVSTSFSDISEF